MQLCGIVGYEGKRLPIPQSCNIEIKKLLSSCFGDKRPTFDEIIIILRLVHLY